MKLYIATDLEGVTGVTGGWSEISPDCREHDFARKMLTADINAVAKGAFDGGAREIVVWDGHGAALSVNIEDLDPRIRLIKGRAIGHLPLLDESFDAMMIVGMHAKEGVSDGIMNGTWSGNGMRLWLNGKEVGELGLWMALAAQYGVPTIMVTGDTAVEREARELVGNVHTVAVKIGLNRYCCEIIPPVKAWENLTGTARKAVAGYRTVDVYNPAKPVELRMQHPVDTQLVDWIAVRPGIKRISGDTIAYTSDSLRDAIGAIFYINWWNLGSKPMI
jgi:D-amino peptidase